MLKPNIGLAVTSMKGFWPFYADLGRGKPKFCTGIFDWFRGFTGPPWVLQTTFVYSQNHCSAREFFKALTPS